MTRQEQIAKKVNEICNDPNNDWKSTWDLCQMMAEWADRTMLDKFCEFMQSCEGYVVSGEKCNYENFMKFMEEQ